jgi:outer membrane lipopolysaccharide assembly protein LptE/RlpB
MKHLHRATATALVAGSVLMAVACGYQVAGTATRLPPDIKTIAIPVFTNKSTHFRIEQKVAAAVTREFIDRTSYRVTPDPAGADAELKGTINSVHSGVLTFDPNTGRATTYQIQVTADVELIDLHTKKVVFSNPKYIFRDQYQVSQSAPALFEEDEPALNRLSQDFARTLVTDIIENF